jgi:hypothetical protein
MIDSGTTSSKSTSPKSKLPIPVDVGVGVESFVGIDLDVGPDVVRPGVIDRSGYGRFLRRSSTPPRHEGAFGESTRDVDLALALALTETLALRDLIRPTGSPPELTPVLLAPPSIQGVRS